MIGSISFLAGLVCVYLFLDRRRGLKGLVEHRLPEMSSTEFNALCRDMVCAYSRLLYLGVAFLLFGGFYLFGRPPETRLFYLLLLGGLALGNIPPRFRVLRRLATAGLSPTVLRQRGLVL